MEESRLRKHFLGLTDLVVMRVMLYLFMTAMIFLMYLYLQPILTYESCQLCDGNEYEKILLYFRHGGEYEILFPFNSRILVPYLVSIIPVKDIVTAFLIFNFLFALLSVAIIFYMWRKLNIPTYFIWIGLFWMEFHWIGIIRLNIFDPITVDLPLYIIAALLVLIIYSQKFYFLLLLGPIAVMQKESIIPLLVALFLVQLIYWREIERRKMLYVVLAILFSVVVKIIVESYFPSIETGKNSVRSLLINGYSALIDPFKLMRWVVAIFMAFGSLIIIAIINYKPEIKKSFFNDSLTMLAVVSIGLGLLGGGDMTRIMFLGYPFIMTWIFLQLKGEKSYIVIFCLIISLPLFMLQGAIPDPGLDLHKFSQWYPEFAEKSKVLIWGIFLIVSIIAVLALKRYANSKV